MDAKVVASQWTNKKKMQVYWKCVFFGCHDVPDMLINPHLQHYLSKNLEVLKHSNSRIRHGISSSGVQDTLLPFASPLLRVWLVILLLPMSLSGQPDGVALDREGVHLRVRLWTPESGLPHWHVGGMFQDSRGYVWMQHHAFLSRFDGTSFRVVDTLPIGPAARPVAFFAEDNRGRIWCYRISDEGRSLRIVDPFALRTESFEAYTGVQDAPEDVEYVYSIDSIVYVVSLRQQKMWRYDGTWSLVLHDPYPKGPAHCAVYLPGPNGFFWYTDNRGVLYLMDAAGAIQRQFDVKSGPNGVKMYYGGRDFFRYASKPEDPGFLIPRPLLGTEGAPPASPLHWFFPRWGDLRALPDLQATLYYNQDVGRPTLYRHADGFSMDIMQAAAEALEMPMRQALLYTPFPCYFMVFNAVFRPGNVLLLPVEGKGFLQVELQPKRFQTLAAHTSIRSLCWNGPDKILAISAAEESFLLECSASANRERSIPWWCNPYSAASDGGHIWVGSRNANLTRLDASYRVRAEYPRPPGPDGAIGSVETRCITNVGDTALWYGAKQGILSLHLGSGVYRYLLQDREGCWIHRDRQGAYWVGTSRGLYHVASGKTYLDTLGGSALRIHHIYEAPDGYFWLSTLSGLVRWRPFSQAYTCYNQHSGLISKQIHAAYPDRQGRLWLSSNGGIMAFDPSDGSVSNFTTADGLSDNEHNYLAHTQGPDGRLYFGGIKGITAFDPNAFPRDGVLKPFVVQVDEVQQLNRDGQYLPLVYPDADRAMALHLQASCIQAVIRLSMPNLLVAKPRIAWRIGGVSPQWTDVELEQGITLSGIPHGALQLDIRVTNPSDHAKFEVFKVNLYKSLYMHQQPWFRALVLSLIAGCIILLMRLRTAGLKARNLALEQKVAERTQTISTQKQELERIDQARSQLFNNISHEFRTPLSIIQGYAEKLQTDLADRPLAAASLRQIEKQTALLTSMLAEVMDLSRLQMGTLDTHPEPVVWQTFLRQTAGMLQGLAARKNQLIQLDISPDEETHCLIDRVKTARIIHNLMANAIKFTPEGGRIDIRSTVDDQTINLTVSDTGPGVLPEERTLIFERYGQGHAARGCAQPGYGIGLALSREYAQLLGASLELDAPAASGASFTLKIPLVPASMQDAPAQQLERSEKPDEATGKLRNGHILVVEDSADLLAFIQEILETDYRVSTAANGQEAWTLLEGDTSIDLVVSDAMMPVLDGFELLARTRKHPRLGFTPFIMLTALSDEQDRLRALRLGVDGFVTKPFQMHILQTQIDNRIRQQVFRKAIQADMRPLLDQDGLPQLPLSYEESWLQHLQAEVQQHLHLPGYKVSDLAAAMHMTERTLFNRVTAYTGLTPSAYIRKARLDQAMHYVTNRTFKTNKELANAVGMTDARHFASAFKKAFGVTPDGDPAAPAIGDGPDQ